MKMYSHEAEAALLDKAKSISAHPATWRCIYIDFSSHKESYSDGLRTHIVTTIFKELLEKEDGYIYLCADGDVFILFQGKVNEILAILGSNFKELGEENRQETLYTTFDLSIKWQPFFALCEQKAALFMRGMAARMPAASHPLVPLRTPNAELFKAASAKRASRNRTLVLIVEDDPFTRRLVSGVLKGEFDIIEAGCGTEAINAYESQAPDAVFLDIELPDSNGHAILNKFITLDPSAFVVMLSANSVKENILAALEKGAQGFVTKPFAKEKLLHYLRLCQTARQNRTLAKIGASHV